MSPVWSQPLKQVTSTDRHAPSPPGVLSAAFPLVGCGGTQALHSNLFPSATDIANSWALLQVASLANTGAFEKFNTSKLVLWSLLKTEFDSVHKRTFGFREQKRGPEGYGRAKHMHRKRRGGDAETTPSKHITQKDSLLLHAPRAPDNFDKWFVE